MGQDESPMLRADVIVVNFRVLPQCLACAPRTTTPRVPEMGQWADWPLPKEHAQIHGQDRCASPGGLHLDCEFWIELLSSPHARKASPTPSSKQAMLGIL